MLNFRVDVSYRVARSPAPHRMRCAPVAALLGLACLAVVADPASGAAAFTETHKLTASDGALLDEFGHAAAISGTTGIVGAWEDDPNGSASGSAYLFNTSTGNESFKLSADDAAAGDNFGVSVAVDGTRAIVGAWKDDADTGAAYIFDTTTGDELFKLTADDAAAGDNFGISVGISGNRAIVGAFNNNSLAGSAYLFDVATGDQLLKLTATDAAPNDSFGVSVAISGNRAIVGAELNDDDGTNSGSAYLFDVALGTELFKLRADDADAFDQFGFSVAIDGSTAIVGAHKDDDDGSLSGSAYLFDVGTGDELFKLTASDAAGGDQFGYSVGVSGSVAVVGAIGNDDVGLASGSAYLFDVLTGLEFDKLLASDASSGDTFGSAVGISGTTAIVGAELDDSPSINSGSAYVFEYIAGDVNTDANVNVVDLGLMAAQWGTPGTPTNNADIAPFPLGDGTVTVADLGTLAANWGAGGGSSASGAVLIVPTPGAALCGLVIFSAAMTRRRSGHCV